jgi:hypothetical protein
MNLDKTVENLRAERIRLDEAIAALEALQAGVPINDGKGRRKRRGRKSMGSAERDEVSRRMKKYWAGQRQKKRHEKDGHAGAFEGCAPCREQLEARLAEIDREP